MEMTFAEEIGNRIAQELDGMEIEVREVEKENDIVQTGVVIRSKDFNIAPTIYLNDQLSVEENVEMVLSAYEKYKPNESLDFNWFTDYEQVKEKLAVMLTSKPRKDLVTRKAPGFDDLYMQAYVPVSSSLFGEGSIKITHEHMKKWDISNAKLFSDALKSSEVTMPAVKKSMFEQLISLGAPTEITAMPIEISMYVLSNAKSNLGASAILYTKVKENTYMIPSSLHEVILLDGEVVDPNVINSMIEDVNANVLNPADYLSNHAYRFNGKRWENVA